MDLSHSNLKNVLRACAKILIKLTKKKKKKDFETIFLLYVYSIILYSPPSTPHTHTK